MATRAGDAQVVNARQTVNALSNTVRNDPTSLDISLQTYETSIDGMASSPNMKGATAAKFRTTMMQHGYEEIVKSAALGHIEKTGEIPDWVSKPEYSKYINGAELKQFEQAAKNYKSLHNSEARSARLMYEHGLTTDFNRKLLDLKTETIPKNDGDSPVPPENWGQRLRDLAKHPGAALPGNEGKITAAENQFAGMARRLSKPEPLGPDSAQATIGLMQRMQSQGPDRLTDDKPINEAYFAGNLTKADYNFLRKEFADMKTVAGEALNHERGEFFKRYEGFIDPQAQQGFRTPDGQARMYQAQVAARRLEEMARAAGKSPHEVYDPDSPYYFGRPANLLKFGPRTLQQQQLDKAAKQAPAASAPAEQPGRLGTTETGRSVRVPPALNGIGVLEFNNQTQQFRDPKSGKRYDVTGKEVTAASPQKDTAAPLSFKNRLTGAP
jgi:hypothetical protein